MTTWASVSSIRLSSLFYLYVYTVSTINDMADFCICICVTDFVYFHMLYNHCGYTIPGVVTGNGWQAFESVRFGNPVCAGHTGLLTYANFCYNFV